MLHPPTQRAERIGVFGPNGSGKTWCWMTVAEWLCRTKSSAHVYALDSDRAWEDAAPYDGHLDPYVTAFQCRDWDDIRTSVRKLQAQDIDRNDWLVVDMMNRAWTFVQQAYYQKAYGKDIDEFFTIGDLAERARAISGSHGTNWQAINAMYAPLSQLISSRWPGHILCCTTAKNIWEGTDEANKIAVEMPEMKRVGERPEAQKDFAGQMRTLLYLQQSPSGWRFSTVKERNPVGLGEGDDGYRPYVAGEMMRDFVRDYLMKIGGWGL